MASLAGVVSLLALVVGCPPQGPPAPAIATAVALELVASGLTAPLGMAVPGDGSSRLFVIDQAGRIRILDGAGTLLSEPFLDLTDRMVPVGIDFGGGIVFDERGLLGLAFHPQYATNGRFFVFYTAPKGPGVPESFNAETHVSEFRVSNDDPNRGDPTSERILLTIPKPQFNHNGGQLAFGPDGYLYVSIGDGGAANDVGDGHTPDLGNGQDTTTLLGKILRIDVDHGNPYAIPADNPFVGADGGVREEIYAYGLRNPWRFSFDTGDAHRLFVADVGQDLFEEVDIVERGGNYGWNRREGLACFDPDNTTMPPDSCATTGAAGEPLRDPILAYPHTDSAGGTHGIAVIGGFVYRGTGVPDLQGDYVFADWSRNFAQGDGSVFAAHEEADGTWTMRELQVAGATNGRIGRFILGLGQDEKGELYVLSTSHSGPVGQTGQVHRIVSAE